MLKLRTNLHKILGEKRMPQAELARETDIAPNTINSIYHDRWVEIRRDTITKICDALGITHSELFEIIQE